MENDRTPADLPAVKEMIAGLRDLIAAETRRVCVIAGADLAHVGPRFGGDEPVSDLALLDLARADGDSLAFVAAGDADGFYRHVALDENARNICGVGAVFVALKTLDPCRVKLLGYEQWVDDDRSSCVTFAGCAIT